MNYVLLIVISIIMTVFFSVMITSFSKVNKLLFEIDKKQGLLSSKIISYFLTNPGLYLLSIRIASIITFVLLGFSVILSYANIFIISSKDLSSLIIITVSVFLILYFSKEYLPKVLSIISPNVILNVFAFPVFFFFIIFYPFSILIHRKIGEKDNSDIKTIDFYELISDKKDDVKEGTSNNDELILIQKALDFASVKVRDCMIPRAEIVALEVNSSIEELKQKMYETGFSKIPIYEDNFDNIIGYVTSKELFKNPDEIRSHIIEISFVPEAMAAHVLLPRLIQEHKSMAVVIDEFGGISGIVTVEDIIEEIFGEIEDEHDNPDITEKIIGKNEYIFSGRLEIEVLNNKYNLNIPESEEYDTLAGYLFFHFQNFPKPNETIVIDIFEFKILKVTKTRIELVKLRVLD